MHIIRDLANAPEYMPGDIVLTEPCSEPQAGRMMVATKEGERVLGRCERVGSGFALVSGRERHPSAAVKLVGVAVEHHKDLRNR